MGHLDESFMEGKGKNEELGKNNTFGGFGFDVCNADSCLGGDTLTVKMSLSASIFIILKSYP